MTEAGKNVRDKTLCRMVGSKRINYYVSVTELSRSATSISSPCVACELIHCSGKKKKKKAVQHKVLVAC